MVLEVYLCWSHPNAVTYFPYITLGRHRVPNATSIHHYHLNYSPCVSICTTSIYIYVFLLPTTPPVVQEAAS